MDERAKLLRLSDVAGPLFGTENFGLFLHSLVRLHVPQTIVELGTGLGVSAFWMASAAKRNGSGHVWTVDNLNAFESASILGATMRKLIPEGAEPGPAAYYRDVVKLLGLEDHITFINETVELSETSHFDRYPFADRKIDLLFSDFMHGPSTILWLLAQMLPRMASASSIFIDSASTNLACFLLLERLANDLNEGIIPAELQRRCQVDLSDLLRGRRIVLVHLTKVGRVEQNSTAWLKIEPRDVLPHPRVFVSDIDPR